MHVASCPSSSSSRCGNAGRSSALQRRPSLIVIASLLRRHTPRSAVIRLLPRLAAFAPERFASDYLHKCVAHLLSVLKHTGEACCCSSRVMVCA